MKRGLNKKICVKRRDITQGDVGEANSCPIALACRRVLGSRYYDLHVDRDRIEICVEKSGEHDHYYRGKTPKKARAFVDAFDSIDKQLNDAGYDELTDDNVDEAERFEKKLRRALDSFCFDMKLKRVKSPNYIHQ